MAVCNRAQKCHESLQCSANCRLGTPPPPGCHILLPGMTRWPYSGEHSTPGMRINFDDDNENNYIFQSTLGLCLWFHFGDNKTAGKNYCMSSVIVMIRPINTWINDISCFS